MNRSYCNKTFFLLFLVNSSFLLLYEFLHETSTFSVDLDHPKQLIVALDSGGSPTLCLGGLVKQVSDAAMCILGGNIRITLPGSVTAALLRDASRFLVDVGPAIVAIFD